MRTFVLGVLAATALTACAPRARQSDIAEVGQRHGYRHLGECHSWISSFKTGHKYCASPVVEVGPYVDPASGLPEPDGPVTKEAMMARGEKVYNKICVACHQSDGKGVAGQYPPLAGAGSYYGDPQNHARIIVHGLSGQIQVLGQTYNGAMPGQGQLTDYEVASVATFVRHSWGNDDGMVVPDDVKAVR